MCVFLKEVVVTNLTWTIAVPEIKGLVSMTTVSIATVCVAVCVKAGRHDRLLEGHSYVPVLLGNALERFFWLGAKCVHFSPAITSIFEPRLNDMKTGNVSIICKGWGGKREQRITIKSGNY